MYDPSDYDYSEFSPDIQAQFAGMTRKEGPINVFSFDYDAYNYPEGVSHTRQISLSGVVRDKWLATLPTESQDEFYTQHQIADTERAYWIDKELEERKKSRLKEMVVKGATFMAAGAAVPMLFSPATGGLYATTAGTAGMGVAPSGAAYITEAGLPAALQAAPAATGSLAGLSAAAAVPSVLDNLWSFGESIVGTIKTGLGFIAKGEQISQVFDTEADTTGAQEYRRLVEQGQITGPGALSAGPGMLEGVDPVMIYLIGGIVLLFLSMRR